MRLSLVGRGLLLALVSVLLSGCGLLLPGLYGFSPTEPDPYYPIPSTPPFAEDVNYTSGSASLDVTEGGTKGTFELGELVDGSQTYGMTNATWRGTEGWSLTVNAFSLGDATFAGNKNVSIQRVNGNDVWLASTEFNPTACTVVIDEMSDKRLKGNATCRNLRWADGLGQNDMSFYPPKYIEGQDPFSVDITFEATAKEGQTS